MKLIEQFTKPVMPTPYVRFGKKFVHPMYPRHQLLGPEAKENFDLLDVPGSESLFKADTLEAKLKLKALAMVSDFYVLNYLRFWSGVGMEENGYPLTETAATTNSKLQEKIKTESGGTTLKLACCLIDAMDRAIKHELRHALFPWERVRNEDKPKYKNRDPDNEFSQEYEQRLNYDGWLAQFPTKEDAFKFSPNTTTIEQAEAMYRQPWSHSYGGEP
jgi:hypothetical protein